MLKFNLTDRWRKRVLALIADNELLEVTFARTGRNKFKLYAGIDGDKIFEMDTFTLNVGDEIAIDDFKTTYSIDR